MFCGFSEKFYIQCVNVNMETKFYPGVSLKGGVVRIMQGHIISGEWTDKDLAKNS